MTDNVFKITEKKPASKEAIVDILRGLIDKAYAQEIVYLEVTSRAKGERSVNSISIMVPDKTDSPVA